MSENKHFGRGFAGKGYYIALILCVAAIGITGYLYYRNTGNTEEVIVEQPMEDSFLVGTMATEADVPVLATQPQKDAPEIPSSQPTTPAVKNTMKVVSPLEGDTLMDYAMEALSYNQTTRDWRVHNGIDIAAQEGTPVSAAAEGTVYTSYEDDSMGSTVVIRHQGGYTTKYSCLQENIPVKAGDTVEAGQTIGYVGSSALVETTLGSHLHFSVTHQDIPMDPAEFLALGN